MVLVIAAIILTLLFSNSIQFDKKRICIWIGFCLFAISACKSTTAYGDLIGYGNRYLTLSDITFEKLWEQYIDGEMKDFGFYAIAKLFSNIGLSTGIWMAAIALFFAVCVAICIYLNSEEPFLSLMALLALYYRFILSGLRQTMALGFILIAYIMIKERKLIPYLLLVAAAFLCHSSSLIFLPAYWLIYMKVNYKQLIIIVIALGICLVTPSLVRLLVSSFSWNESIEWYADTTVTLTWSGYIIQFMILIFCICFKNRVQVYESKRKNESDTDSLIPSDKVDIWINLMVIGLCIQGASSIIAEAFRASYYYSMGCLFAVPTVIVRQDDNLRKILYYGVSLAFLAYIFWSDAFLGLVFFWQT